MVQIQQVLQAFSIASLVAADAPVKTNSPEGAKYIATFNDKIEGTVKFSTASNKTVQVEVDLSGLPSSGGPFPYHIHALPVPANGDCLGTKGHLNPYNGSESAQTPEGKEAGDLSGKHGVITEQSFQASYIEQYISLNENDPAFAGNLSVVVHFANTTRIACANITKDTSGSSNDTTSTVSSANAAVVNSGNGQILLGAAAAALGLLI